MRNCKFVNNDKNNKKEVKFNNRIEKYKDVIILILEC